MRTPSLRAKVMAHGICCTVLLIGCWSFSAQGGETVVKHDAKPSAEQLRQALHPAYVTPAGSKQECLGRLVFDLRGELQWGVSAPTRSRENRLGFGGQLDGGQDKYVSVDDVSVVVSAPATWKQIEGMERLLASDKVDSVAQYKALNESDQRANEERSTRLADRNINLSAHEKVELLSSVEESNNLISRRDSIITALQKDWHPMDLGLPDSLGYAAGPNLYAFLLRDGRAYQFMSNGGEGGLRFEERRQAFLDLLKQFRARKLYELPSTPGICIPYGFIPDNGRRNFRMEVSFRYSDQSGVIYTIGTAVVGDKKEPAFDRASSIAGAANLVPWNERMAASGIGPRNATIGALPAHQGAFSWNVAHFDKPPARTFIVYTGYPGWGYSQVLPAITVDMRGITKEQESTLKANPPSLEKSMLRLDALIKSIRLRPTNPTMPELSEAMSAKAGE